MPQIEVTFDIDANGILHVSAKDKATGKEQSIRIEASSGLNEDEIQKHGARTPRRTRARTSTRKEAVEARNRADPLVYEVEKNLKEHGDKLDADDSSREVEDDARPACARRSRARTRGDRRRRARRCRRPGTRRRRRSTRQAAPPPGGGRAPAPRAGRRGRRQEEGGGDGAVDADYEVVN